MIADPKEKPKEGGVMGPPAELSDARHIGQGLTPRRVSQIILAADGGDMSALHDALNDVRQKDLDIQSVLQTREKALTGSGWSIISNPRGAEKDSAEWRFADEIGAFVREAMTDCEGVDRAFEHMQDAVCKGTSVVETIWWQDGKTLLPEALECKGGRRFAYDQQQRVCWYEPQAAGHTFPGLPLLETYPHRFLIHQPRINGDEPHREGVGRALLWYACFSLWAWRDWLLFSELYGKPWREVIYSDDAGPEEILLAQEIAARATSKTAVWHPSSISLELHWPDAPGGASASPSPEIIRTVSQKIALGVLGQLGTTGDVQGGLGGKGDAREKVRKDILRGDERSVCATVRRYLFRPLVFFKFGERGLRYLPTLSFNIEDAPDVNQTMEAFTKAVGLGMQIPKAHAHDVSGMPMAQKGEDVLGSTPATTEPAPADGEKPVAPKDDKKPA